MLFVPAKARWHGRHTVSERIQGRYLPYKRSACLLTQPRSSVQPLHRPLLFKGVVCFRSFHAMKGAAQRGAAQVSSHRKEHRRRQHGHIDTTVAASQPVTAAGRPTVADSSALKHARGEQSHSAAWDRGVFELSHEQQPRLSGPPGGFASIGEAALVVRRGHAAQQQPHHQPPQHAQLPQDAQHTQHAQPTGSGRQLPAAGSRRPVAIMRTAAPGPHAASDGRQDSHAACPAAAAGSDLSVVSQHGSGAGGGNSSSLMSGSAVGALIQPSSAAVRFRVGGSTAHASSAAAGPVSARSAASPAQHDARPEASSTSASDPAPPSSVTNPWVDSSAALCASAVTSVLEGPMEMFRHRLQVSVSETLNLRITIPPTLTITPILALTQP